MKVYVASSFDLRSKVQEISDLLEREDIEITRKWWFKDFKTAFGEIGDDEWFEKPEIHELAGKNFAAIDAADAVVLVCADNESRKFVGANVEVGYAIAKGKPVYSVGKLERSAMYAPVKRRTTGVELVQGLNAQTSKGQPDAT